MIEFQSLHLMHPTYLRKSKWCFKSWVYWLFHLYENWDKTGERSEFLFRYYVNIQFYLKNFKDVDVGWNKVYKLRSNFEELSEMKWKQRERKYWWRWCLIYFRVDMWCSYRCHNNQIYVVMMMIKFSKHMSSYYFKYHFFSRVSKNF